jgi:hypothetical protein
LVLVVTVVQHKNHAQVVQKESIKMKKQKQVVKVALQESIQLKLIQRLLIHVKIVQQENIHLLKVFQVVLVVMIVHPVNIQQQIQVIMMKVNVLTVQQIRTV